MKMNEKGFTLVELLGVFAILGIIMLVAIPNVMGILDRNKKNTFVEHAKEMIALTEYKMASNNTIAKVEYGKVIIFTLGYLNTDDIQTSANGVEYDVSNSFVAVYRNPSSGIQYFVTLREKETNKGIELVSQTELNQSNMLNKVGNVTIDYDIESNNIKLSDSIGTVNVQALYR